MNDMLRDFQRRRQSASQPPQYRTPLGAAGKCRNANGDGDDDATEPAAASSTTPAAMTIWQHSNKEAQHRVLLTKTPLECGNANGDGDDDATEPATANNTTPAPAADEVPGSSRNPPAAADGDVIPEREFFGTCSSQKIHGNRKRIK